MKDVVAIGTFDGVHLGHQRVLAAAREQAGEGSESVAYTFDMPPRAWAHGDTPCLLLPPSVKRRLLLGWADRVVEASFPALRDLTPSDFVHRILVDELEARAVVVGESFRFGRERSGDAGTLASLCAGSGIDCYAMPALHAVGGPVSSSRIRLALAAGDVDEARALLGRPPLLRGGVVAGDAIGRTLGFPTANLRLDPRVLLPRHGVYISRAYAGRSLGLALTYCGRRPTLGGDEVRCEVHLLVPPSRDLRGTEVEVHLYSLLRPDRPFATLAELRRQMEEDRRRAEEKANDVPEVADPVPFGG